MYAFMWTVRSDRVTCAIPMVQRRLMGGTCRSFLARHARAVCSEKARDDIYLFRPAGELSNEQRALINNLRPLTFWWPEDLVWACAGAIADATRRNGHPIHRARAHPPIMSASTSSRAGADRCADGHLAPVIR